MNTGDFLNIHPTELKFQFELGKQSSCSMQLTNKTDQYIAFKVKTTNPRKYCVRPNAGIVLPRSTCDVTVAMQAPKETPLDMQCKDKFLVQSVVAPDGATTKDITQDMFTKQEGKVVEDFKMRVVYIPTNRPSPVPEGSEEGSPPRTFHDGVHQVARSSEEPKGKSSSSEASALMSKLTEEKATAIQQNQKLHLEMEMMRRELSNSSNGFSVLFVVLVGIIGVLFGYFIKKT